MRLKKEPGERKQDKEAGAHPVEEVHLLLGSGSLDRLAASQRRSAHMHLSSTHTITLTTGYIHPHYPHTHHR